MGKKVTLYIRTENEEFIDDLLQRKKASEWLNEQINRAIMYSSKNLNRKIIKSEEDLDFKQHELRQLKEACKKAIKREEERKQRIKEMQMEEPLSEF